MQFITADCCLIVLWVHQPHVLIHDTNDGDWNASSSCIHTKCWSCYLRWVSLWSCCTISPLYIPAGENAGCWANRNLAPEWLCLFIHGMWVPLCPPAGQDLILFDFPIIFTLMGKKYYILAVLICIFWLWMYSSGFSHPMASQADTKNEPS